MLGESPTLILKVFFLYKSTKAFSIYLLITFIFFLYKTKLPLNFILIWNDMC